MEFQASLGRDEMREEGREGRDIQGRAGGTDVLDRIGNVAWAAAEGAGLEEDVLDVVGEHGSLWAPTCPRSPLSSDSDSDSRPRMSLALALRRAAARPRLLSRCASTAAKHEPDPQLDGYPQLPFVSRQR
ncbi:hypothetical protein E4T56_gene5642, partial [Termitomyces sp. T112]